MNPAPTIRRPGPVFAAVADDAGLRGANVSDIDQIGPWSRRGASGAAPARITKQAGRAAARSSGRRRL